MTIGQGARVSITNVEETAAALAAAVAAGGGLGGGIRFQVDPATLLPLLTAQTNLIRDDIANISVADNAAAFLQVRQDIAGIVIPPPVSLAPVLSDLAIVKSSITAVQNSIPAPVSLAQVNSKLDAILAGIGVTPPPPPVNLMPTIGLVTAILVATEPGSVLITASPADADGSITKVEYYDNAAFIGQRVQAPFTFTHANVLAGQHSYTAKAYDNATPAGTAISAASLVTINPVVVPPPVVIAPVPVQII